MKRPVSFLLHLIVAPVIASANPVASLQTQSCKVWVDARSIAHVQANDTLTGYACLGLLHGRDRAFELEYMMRSFQGRTAEISGLRGLQQDFFLKLLNLRHHAERIFKEIPSDKQDFIRAYAHGINVGLKQASATGVREFRDLDIAPQEWVAEDVIAVVLLESFDQTRVTFEQDIQEQSWIERYGLKALPDFMTDDLPWDTSIVKQGEFTPSDGKHSSLDKNVPASSMSFRFSELKELWPQSRASEGKGSNNWVVAPQRSQTGHAWVANDPHLPLTSPPFWYWVHLKAGTMDVMGATLPGVPLVVSGANRFAAWGLTTAKIDVADVISVPESALPALTSERPTIWFRFWKLKLPFIYKSMRRLADGTVILPKEKDGRVLLLRWTGFHLRGEDLNGFFTAMTAKNTKELDESFKHVGVPGWNFVFADIKGNIGYRVTGQVPKRVSPLPYGIPKVEKLSPPLPEWGLEDRPHLSNPARGYIASANNRSWPAHSHLHEGHAFSQGFRAFRIEELITRTPKHSLETLRNIQCDAEVVDARFLLPLMLKHAQSAPAFVLDAWKNWNYQSDKDCRACGVYRRWIDRLDPRLNLNYPAAYRYLKKGLTADMAKALEEELPLALRDLGVTQNPDSLKPWGVLHVAPFEHLSTLAEFSPDDVVPTPGDHSSVNLGSADWDGARWVHNDGPSQRLIVELTTPPQLYMSFPGRNDGQVVKNIANEPAYSAWRDCRLEPVEFPTQWPANKTVEIKL